LDASKSALDERKKLFDSASLLLNLTLRYVEAEEDIIENMVDKDRSNT
jgi:hypothetical protein